MKSGMQLLAVTALLAGLQGCYGCFWAGADNNKCSESPMAEALSPSGARKAVAQRRTCTYQTPFSTDQHSTMNTQVYVQMANGSGENIPIFSAWQMGVEKQTIAPEVSLSWTSETDVVVRYPAGFTTTCMDANSSMRVHCVEQAAPSAAAASK